MPAVAVGRCPVVPLLIVSAPVELKVESAVAVKAPVMANVEPFHVRLELSLNKPDAPAKVTRPEVRLLSVAVPPITVLPLDAVTLNFLVLIVMLPAET